MEYINGSEPILILWEKGAPEHPPARLHFFEKKYLGGDG
jgi:hypothetical protein